MHQNEKPVGIILDLDVHVELHMLILRLRKILDLKAQATTKEGETQETCNILSREARLFLQKLGLIV